MHQRLHMDENERLEIRIEIRYFTGHVWFGDNHVNMFHVFGGIEIYILASQFSFKQGQFVRNTIDRFERDFVDWNAILEWNCRGDHIDV